MFRFDFFDDFRFCIGVSVYQTIASSYSKAFETLFTLCTQCFRTAIYEKKNEMPFKEEKRNLVDVTYGL